MNDDVVFWTWINDTTLGMVTDRDVHHWKVIEGQQAPVKVSTRLILPSCLGNGALEPGIDPRSSTDTHLWQTTKSSTTGPRVTAHGLSLSVSRPTPLLANQDPTRSRSKVLCNYTRLSEAFPSLSRVTQRHSPRSN